VVAAVVRHARRVGKEGALQPLERAGILTSGWELGHAKMKWRRTHFEPRRHAKYNLILPCTLARSTRIVYVVQLSTLEGGEVRVGDLYGF